MAGCGPGGMAAALLLHRQGHRVTLFERFDAPGPVGSGLLIQPVGLAVLDALGLGDRIREQGARIDGLHGFSMPSGRRALDVDYAALRGGLCAYGVHRALLFETLFQAVTASGIAIETGRTIVAAEPVSGARRRLRFAKGETGPFDLVVDALGARTPLAPPTGGALTYGALWTTLDWADHPGALPAKLDQRYRGARQMAGILPIGANPATGRPGAAYFWSLKTEDHPAFLAAGLEAWRHEALALWPESSDLLAQIADVDQFTFARYAHRTLSRPVAPGLIHLGDAWHSTSPQLGQGANMALLDAAALAHALAQSGALADRLSHYDWLRQGHVGLYQAMSRTFTPLYQSDSAFLPALRDRLIDPFARWPLVRRILVAMVAGHVGAPLRPLGISPRAGSRDAGSLHR